MVLAKIKPQECGKMLSMVRAVHSSPQPKTADATTAPVEHQGFPFWLQPRFKIGKREVVGYGLNGRYEYCDRKDWPYPAVRWQEPSNESTALHEKEKGDWSKLSMEEKKALYRYSYRITFEEMTPPTGDWKMYLSAILLTFGAAWWMWLFSRVYIVGHITVPTTTAECEKEQLRLMLLLHSNAVEGVASKWDYEKGKWKNEK